MSSEPNHHLKANFFKCVTDVLQFLVKRLHTTEIKNLLRRVLGADPSRHGYYFQTVGSAHSSMAQKWFMDSQLPIIEEGDISKMNIATCFMVLHYTTVCGLAPPDSDVWIDRNDRRPLEYQITLMFCQLISVVYSKDTFDIIQQNEIWDNFIDTIKEMKKVVVGDYYSIDFDGSFSKLVECWSFRKEFGSIDLTEYKRMLEFSIRREILENLNLLKPISFLDFCLNKKFSNFKISHFNTNELVSYTDIFDWKDKEEKYPQVYIICGERGVGKSFYLKFVYQQFSSDSSIFIGIDKYDIVIFIESLDNSVHCLDEYINRTLQNTAMKFKLSSLNIQEILLRGKILVILDSFDVATPETHQLMKELSTISINITLLFATRPDTLDNLCEKLPKNKKPVILYPEANDTVPADNESHGKIGEIKGLSVSSEVPIEIPPGYETSFDSKVLMDVEKLRKDLYEDEVLTINDETPRDKKKPSARIIKNTFSKLKSLIEQYRTAAAQLDNHEADLQKCELQEMLDEYGDLHKDTDALNKKLPHGMRTELYKSGESIFHGILYWFERIVGEHDITSNEILDNFESNYSKVKYHLHPKPKTNMEPDRDRPSHEVIIKSQSTLSDLYSDAKEAVAMIEKYEGRTDQETKLRLLEMVIDIRNLRERCDLFNASLPKEVMYIALCERKHMGIFVGLNYFFYMVTKEMANTSAYEISGHLIKEFDMLDKKIRNHLLKPQSVQPKLAKSWKSDDLPKNKKNKTKKNKVKKKCKTGW